MKLIPWIFTIGLTKLLESTKGEIVIGGQSSAETQKIDVTVVDNVAEDDALLESELFGPILPVLSLESKEEIVKYINDRDNPLALYVFTSSKADSQYSKLAGHSFSIKSSLFTFADVPFFFFFFFFYLAFLLISVFDNTRSGGFVQNDVLVQFLIPGLPFGGSGPSGSGNYHGKASVGRVSFYDLTRPIH